jgi:hypothetical protein
MARLTSGSANLVYLFVTWAEDIVRLNRAGWQMFRKFEHAQWGGFDFPGDSWF